jgi:epoxyqueuosine reductase
MGNRIYGCDDCLAVCPWNKFAHATTEPAFLPRAELTAPRLADLAQLDDAGFRQLFTASPIKRIGSARFIRNVLIALGNSGDVAQIPVVEVLCGDDDPVVRDAAAWAVGRLKVASP